MAENSKIEWTESSWNPVVGCTKVSPGCDHCYAETLVNRFAGRNKGFPNTFDVVTLRGAETLTQPLRWTRPRRIFVNSLSDLFHDDVPDLFIAQVFAIMALAPRHTFQVLTKRHGRMRSLLSSDAFVGMVGREFIRWTLLGKPKGTAWYYKAGDPRPFDWPLPNVWLGVSAEDQHWADIRIPALLDTPAAVRFLSVEPMLGPLDLSKWLAPHSLIHWVICGAESGHDARPMDEEWARTVKDQCVAADVPFFLKQYAVNGRKLHVPELDGRQWMQYPKIPPQISSTDPVLL